MQLGLAPARRQSAAEQEALDALCCTPPMTIDGARAAIEYVMAVKLGSDYDCKYAPTVPQALLEVANAGGVQ